MLTRQYAAGLGFGYLCLGLLKISRFIVCLSTSGAIALGVSFTPSLVLLPVTTSSGLGKVVRVFSVSVWMVRGFLEIDIALFVRSTSLRGSGRLRNCGTTARLELRTFFPIFELKGRRIRLGERTTI